MIRGAASGLGPVSGEDPPAGSSALGPGAAPRRRRSRLAVVGIRRALHQPVRLGAVDQLAHARTEAHHAQ